MIWRALTSVQESLAEGDERARRYPAAIAPFAATVDTEPASFRSLLALVDGDDQIALFTTEEVQPPSAFSVVRRASIDQMVLRTLALVRHSLALRSWPLGSPMVPRCSRLRT